MLSQNKASKYDRQSDQEFVRSLHRANAYWDAELFNLALEEYREALNILLRKQETVGRIHKGEEYYNIGRLYLDSSDLGNSMWYICAAYVEDILTGDENSPAYRFLVNSFKIDT